MRALKSSSLNMREILQSKIREQLSNYYSKISIREQLAKIREQNYGALESSSLIIREQS